MNPAGNPVSFAPDPSKLEAVIIPVLPKLALPSDVKVIATPVPDPSLLPTFKSPL